MSRLVVYFLWVHSCLTLTSKILVVNLLLDLVVRVCSCRLVDYWDLVSTSINFLSASALIKVVGIVREKLILLLTTVLVRLDS